MTDEKTQAYAEDLVIQNELGARNPSSKISNLALVSLALCWSLFQLWVVSPLPYMLNIFTLDSIRIRYIHLLFAFALVFLSYPAFSNSPRNKIPISDYLLMFIAISSILYIFIFYNDIANRGGIAENSDLFFGIIGIISLLEATRRSLGLPLIITSVLFILYTYFGQYAPEIIAHKGQDVKSIISHQWLTTEGIFGIALDISASFVFLFVLFGALLDRAGAGAYFIQLAFSLLGHFKGGPAKAAIIASAMTGLISGSSIANVVTTGTFTIPLMRKAGFSREKAGAIEVSSSVNGQIMPPVMGAAAFLMIEYVGITYIQLLKHAIIPATISYIALLYIVHLESLKYDLKALPQNNLATSLKYKFIYIGILVSSLLIISSGFYYIISYLRTIFEMRILLIFMSLILTMFYISSLYDITKNTKGAITDISSSDSDIVNNLPPASQILRRGSYFFIPIFILIWCLTVERFSPDYSAFWACLGIMFIIITQKAFLEIINSGRMIFSIFMRNLCSGLYEVRSGLVDGARNMISIAIATATAGIVVGSITQTGVGNLFAEIISTLSGNSIIITLIMTGMISLILGLGLPTTANYIVVSSLMVNVLILLAQKNGLDIPLVAMHLFVFYFGVMADVTPPVGLAAFAASAISGGKPIKTSVQSFIYSFRTLILPFLFIYNPAIILVGVDSFPEAMLIFIQTTIAILLFTSATQGFLIVKNKIYETILLLLLSLVMFAPNLIMDKIVPPYVSVGVDDIQNTIENLPEGSKNFRLQITGVDPLGVKVNNILKVPIIKSNGQISAQKTLQNFGLIINDEDYYSDYVNIFSIIYKAQASKFAIYPGYKIVDLLKPNKQPSNFLIYIPLFITLYALVILQRRRKKALTA